MTFLFLIALLVFAWQAGLNRLGYSVTWRQRIIPSQFAWFGSAVLPLGFAGEIAAVAYSASHEQFRDKAWLTAMPFHLVYYGAAPSSAAHTNVLIGVLLSIAAQTVGLIGLSFARVDRLNRPAPIVAGVLVALIAITAPVLTSTDVLFYAFVSSIGLQSYSILGVPAASPYHFLVARLPATGNIYGPLWTAFDVAIGSLGRTLHDKIIAFRIANAILLLCAAFAIRYMRYPRTVQIACALNPMLWFYFVVNAHNDIFPVALCLLGVALIRRHPWCAVALVAGAIACKIPYLLMGSFVFLRIRARTRALALATVAAAMGLSLSWLIGGNAYLERLTSYTHVHGSYGGTDVGVRIVALGLLAIAIGFASSALLTRRMHPAALWLFPAVGVHLCPWYLAWGLPYAAVVRRGIAATLLLLPLGAAVGDLVFQMDGIANVAVCATFIFVSADLLYRLLQRARSRVPVTP